MDGRTVSEILLVGFSATEAALMRGFIDCAHGQREHAIHEVSGLVDALEHLCAHPCEFVFVDLDAEANERIGGLAKLRALAPDVWIVAYCGASDVGFLRRKAIEGEPLAQRYLVNCHLHQEALEGILESGSEISGLEWALSEARQEILHLRGEIARMQQPVERNVQARALGEKAGFRQRLPRLKGKPGLRVLVVDDEPLVREILEVYLQQDHYQVTTAANGIEALERFKTAEFDLVLTDRSMPEMNGTQLAAAIKTLKPGQIIILLSGLGDLGEEWPVEVDAMVSKPFTLNTLRAAIASALG